MQVAGDAVAVGEHVEFPHPALRRGQLPGQGGLVGECGDHVELFSRERARTRTRTATSTPATVSVARSGTTRAGLGWPVPTSSASKRCAVRWRKASPTCDLLIAMVRAFNSGWHHARRLDHHKVLDLVGRELGVGRNGDQSALCPGELQRLVGDEPEYGGGIGAGEQLGADVAGGRDPRLPVPRLLVEPGVVDRDTGGGGERLDENLVVLAERLPARLLGQVEVAEHLVADADRDTRGRSASAGGGAGSRRTPGGRGCCPAGSGFGSSISTPSTPRPSGRCPIVARVVFVDAFVDELDELVTVAAHAERAVPGVDELDGGVHDRAQRDVEVEAGGDDEHGVDEAVEAVAALDDLLDAVLDLAEQLAQPQLRQGVAHRTRSAVVTARPVRSPSLA